MASLVELMVKKEFRKALKLKKIYGAVLKADAEADSLNLSGWGTTEESGDEIVSSTAPSFTLTEKQDLINEYLEPVKEKIKYERLVSAVLHFDFKKHTMVNNMRYIKKGLPMKKTLYENL